MTSMKHSYISTPGRLNILTSGCVLIFDLATNLPPCGIFESFSRSNQTAQAHTELQAHSRKWPIESDRIADQSLTANLSTHTTHRSSPLQKPQKHVRFFVSHSLSPVWYFFSSFSSFFRCSFHQKCTLENCKEFLWPREPPKRLWTNLFSPWFRAGDFSYFSRRAVSAIIRQTNRRKTASKVSALLKVDWIMTFFTSVRTRRTPFTVPRIRVFRTEPVRHRYMSVAFTQLIIFPYFATTHTALYAPVLLCEKTNGFLAGPL